MNDCNRYHDVGKIDASMHIQNYKLPPRLPYLLLGTSKEMTHHFQKFARDN